ncbi:recQ-mediated genome instability protein 1 [Mesocricetus auratus]|uniref:RecQ-mediated genome instability protein 1 n=1 Tax=Mesocricetus auratus TaxID=10036 RepID=A0ABM2YB27_MESAU|nr:recQ-mediated genome instability protein 1 [Mesocricetus auratus]XP_040612026.1 recQ-mediated genome instability protein 1 [Mesocricetus auratus]XP_040612027.1 recQ-mediated genome instability protein 1 [Mesocricetus auratus]
MSVNSAVLRVETWLLATWHVKVPLPWLEACVNWIQEENENTNLSQAQVNKQVLEQWLLTDLRDLEHPLLPDNILEIPKGELNGFYALQINSLVDVSQPAYSQIQKLRGKNTTNDLVSAETQVTPKPWEARPSRMLMLQLTDGVTQIQGMEYQSVPALHGGLPPGTKILVHGRISFRLGVLLLKPENVRVLGGEVDGLSEEYAQEKVLGRLIGELDPAVSVVPNDSAHSVPRVSGLGSDPALGPSDEELLASLYESEGPAANDDASMGASGFSAGSSLNTTPTGQSDFEPGWNISSRQKEKPNQSVHFSNGEFDDFSLEEALLLEETVQKEQMETKALQPPTLKKNTDRCVETFSHKPNTQNHTDLIHKHGNNNCNEKKLSEQIIHEDKFFDCPSARDHHKKLLAHDFTNDSETLGVDNTTKENNDSSREHCSSNKMLKRKQGTCLSEKSSEISDENSYPFQTCSSESLENNTDLSVSMDLNSPPFIYLAVLMARKPKEVTTVKVKAFIVTLTGNLSSSGGCWCVTAKVSDGTAYLDVNFIDEILTSMIGFSVAEMKQLKKDPLKYQTFLKGLQKCQRDLIDLCCLMTISFNPSSGKAMVLELQDVSVEHLENLKKRLKK